MHRRKLTIATPGRATLEITGQVQAAVAESGVAEGVANVFVGTVCCHIHVCPVCERHIGMNEVTGSDS